MLLHNVLQLESRCPRWLSAAAVSGLFGMSVLTVGGSLQAGIPPQDELAATRPRQKEQDEPAPKADPTKSEKNKKESRALPREDSSPEQLPKFEDTPESKRFQEQFEFMKKQMRKGWQGVENWQQFELQEGQPLWRGAVQEGRLGLRTQRPSAALADQLDLPKDQGLVVEEVRADSPAAKAGFQPHDILLEFNGKPVPNDLQKLRVMVDEVKADTPVDAVVLRKGKKETIKGISLPEAKRLGRFELRPGEGFQWRGQAPLFQPGEGFKLDPRFRQPPFSATGRHNVLTTVFRTDDRFTSRYQEGSLIITVTGKVSDGKATVGQIEIQDGRRSEKYESVDKVPDRYRDKAKNLVEMTEKGKVEIRTPEKKKNEQPKDESE